MKSGLIDIAGVIHHQTDKAILFSDTAHREDAVWLPKSVVEIEYDNHKNFYTVTMPEQLAVDKGLV